MKILAIAAFISLFGTVALAGPELPALRTAASCTTFGQVATPSCAEKQNEIVERARQLWLQADEKARQACQAGVESAPDPYAALTQCLSLDLGQRRLLAGSVSSWWNTPQR